MIKKVIFMHLKQLIKQLITQVFGFKYNDPPTAFTMHTLKADLQEVFSTSFARGYRQTIELYDRLNRESVQILSQLTKSDLNKKCLAPAGTEITVWKLLWAMVEHEVHHRAVIYTYLGMLTIKAPAILGSPKRKSDRKARAKTEEIGQAFNWQPVLSGSRPCFSHTILLLIKKPFHWDLEGFVCYT